MFWKKKQNEMPILPDLPINPMLENKFNEEEHHDEDMTEIHALPSFPDSPIKKGFSQSMIKNAIETEEIQEDNLPPLPPFNEQRKMQNEIDQSRVMEMDEWMPGQNFQMRTPMPLNKTPGKPIFVRLDKFQAAKESLEMIKEKLKEMDELLKMAKEIKIKEEQEITQWEREVETIKARLGSITSDIFENVY